MWAADTCQHSWTLKEAMSHQLDYNSEIDESSQTPTEYHSEEEDTESEHGTTESESENMFGDIQYSALHYFPDPYLCHWNFRDTNHALRYIMKTFNWVKRQEDLRHFPDLLKDFIYYNTYIDTLHFTKLQQFIQKSIIDHNNALVQKWLELQARYSTSDLNPFIIVSL